MKFMFHLVPTVPATPQEREKLAPIAHRTDKIQEMLEEMIELARLGEDLNFDAISYSEHHYLHRRSRSGSHPHSSSTQSFIPHQAH